MFSSSVRRLFLFCIISCIALPILWLVFSNDPQLVQVANNIRWTQQPIVQYNNDPLNHITMISPQLQGNKYLLNIAGSIGNKNTEAAVLIVCRLYKGSREAQQIEYILLAQRVNVYRYITASSVLMPDLIDVDGNRYLGKYSLIVIIDVIDETIYELFHEYCNKFNAAMIFVTSPTLDNQKFTKGRLYMSSLKMQINHLVIHEMQDFGYLRNGGKFSWTRNSSQIALFVPASNSDSQTIISANVQVGSSVLTLPVTMIEWSPLTDNIIKGYTGLPMTSSIGKLAFLELLQLITRKQTKHLLRFQNKRYIQIDIDDVFFAPAGFNPTKKDIQEMIDTQTFFQNEYFPDFRFYLGFCGIHFQHGTSEEIEGKQELIKNSNLFNWFDHTYSHAQPHKVNLQQLLKVMNDNKQFAKDQGIPLSNNHYCVSPHHSGVYPIYEPLYTAWKEVWNVTVTTTEEYPHFKPFNLRRGFIHKDIMVLPRQTCGVYTHSNYFNNIEGGKTGLTRIAEEGEVFDSILNNPISVFMTHYNNYGSDQLALVLFKTAFSFIKKWTQLELVYDKPQELGKQYFSIFPEDKDPLWTSPCSDKRHMDIWNIKNCSQIPSVIIVGPQKSGSTALHFFLKEHPNLITNKNTKHAFEEVQFFSNDHYYSKGINWYMSNFPPVNKSMFIFEKSATYFTHHTTPERLYTLNPTAKIIIILADPIKRAYSWYQHMKSHNDPTALKYNFSQVITAHKETGAPATLINLRSHSLSYGVYYYYTQKWLEYFKPEQIHFIDGNELIDDPLNVLKSTTQFIGLPYFDYQSILRFSFKKGFYCLINKQGKEVCLGISKGRSYPPISPSCVKYLEKYYSHPNMVLYKLLLKMGRKPPTWLIKGFSS